ncbi:MAG TPA: competence/damage-inducible protein A [Sphingobacteriaceae bacterium]
MIAEIITIGDEILIGQVVDTNSAWMGRKLNDAGVRVNRITSISDDSREILDALRDAAARADIILITGGLGPTRDDVTKKTLAEYFGAGMRRDAETLEQVKRIFARYDAPLLDVNIAQADVPDNCTVLVNRNGTAPGMWFEADGRIYVSMPGVPFEMQYLMEEEVIPRITERFRLPALVHRTILTAGLGESFLASRIEAVEDALPGHIRLAYLPKLGQVRLRLSATGADRGSLSREVDEWAERIIAIIREYVIAGDDIPFEEVILDFMKQRNLTLTLAESCTGGYLSHLFTQVPGASAVYLGGTVSYANELKQQILGVSEETLRVHGAVSEQTAIEMAQGALKNLGSDYAISVTGIAGPGGGTPDKPVGTVWMAAASVSKTVTRLYQFGNRRAQNIERSATSAMLLLLNLLKEEHG